MTDVLPPCCFPDCMRWSVELIDVQLWLPLDGKTEGDRVYIGACAEHGDQVREKLKQHDEHRVGFAWIVTE